MPGILSSQYYGKRRMSGLEKPAVEPIQIILLSINLFVKDWFVGWLNGSLDARYSAIHSWHP